MGGKILDYPAKTYKREGRRELLVEIVQKKLAKDYSVEQIADALEESIETIQEIVDELK
jgi:predicted transposase YdaD